HTAIDANDHAVDVFYLDSIELLLLAALLLLAEWRFGATPGKRLCHVRVQSLGGRALTVVQAAQRPLGRFLPFLPPAPSVSPRPCGWRGGFRRCSPSAAPRP